MATQDKYDRQLRLWGSEGQAHLSKAHVLALGSSAVISETLKNLVLPGIGSIHIVDDKGIDERDMESNYFCQSVTEIQTNGVATSPRSQKSNTSRAHLVASNLQQLNSDVRVSAEHVTNVMDFIFQHIDLEVNNSSPSKSGDSPFAKATLIVCLHDSFDYGSKAIHSIQNTWPEASVIRCFSRGFIGLCRILVPRISHIVYDAKSESANFLKHQLRLGRPFPELLQFSKSIWEGVDVLEKNQNNNVVDMDRNDSTEKLKKEDGDADADMTDTDAVGTEMIDVQMKDANGGDTDVDLVENGAIDNKGVIIGAADSAGSTGSAGKTKKVLDTFWHAHIPYPAILLKAREKFGFEREIKTREEKEEFKNAIKDLRWSMDEENFREALEYAYVMHGKFIPESLDSSSSATLQVGKSTSSKHWERNIQVPLNCPAEVAWGSSTSEFGIKDQADSDGNTGMNGMQKISCKACKDSIVPEDTTMALEGIVAQKERDKIGAACASAVLDFCNDFGVLPLPGALPDMTTDTSSYVQLQRIYRERARKERNLVKKYYDSKEVVTSGDDGRDDPVKRIDHLCKCAFSLRRVDYRTQEEEEETGEEMQPAPKEDDEEEDPRSVDTNPTENEDEMPQDEDSQMAWYFGIRNVLLTEKHEGTNPTQKAHIQSSSQKSGKKLSEQTLSEAKKIEAELARFPKGGELATTSSFMGGIIAQEAIKLISKVYAPLNHTLVYNGISGKTEVIDI